MAVRSYSAVTWNRWTQGFGAVSIATVLSKHQNIMRSHHTPGRCKSVSVSPKQKDTYTHAAEEAIPLWILSLSQSVLMDQSHYKKEKRLCQNQQMSSHSTAGALVSSLHREKQTQVRKKRCREGTREKVSGVKEKS